MDLGSGLGGRRRNELITTVRDRTRSFIPREDDTEWEIGWEHLQ
jgi:hypothetical protein